MNTIIIGGILIILLYIGIGIIASIIPEQYRPKVRIVLIALGVLCFLISFTTKALSIYIGVALFFAGLLFVPLKKQIDMLLDIISLGS